ncbi:MAG: hypothetical protein IT435_02335 [Phycisphaerales bacterium]|nr:hypothetical protein [Phycisphaerales bacterium]
MSQASRPRYVRRRVYERLRHAGSNLKQFLVAQATRLASTPASKTFTADNTTNVFTSSSHGLLTGKGPVVVSNSGGALPTGLAAATFYWPIRIDANTFKLATTRENAARGTAVDISTNGTGTNSVLYSASAAAMLERLRQGVDPNQLRNEDDVDDL